MNDDFSSFLENISHKTEKAIRAVSKSRKTVIVHPTVWKDEKEAKKASKDWRYREMVSTQKELKNAIRGR